jgi:hypothetical protein
MREPCGEIGSVKGSLGRGRGIYHVVRVILWHVGFALPGISGRRAIQHGMTGPRCTSTTLVLYKSHPASGCIT